MRRNLIIIICFGLLAVVSCGKKTGLSTSCTYDPCNGTAPDSQIVRVQAYLTQKNITAVKHCSGLFYQIVTEGTGAQPTACSAVAIKYTGTLTDGTVFDQAVNPVVYNLLQLIEGWKRGLPLIKSGGKIRLFIPPSLGYGPSANGAIPGSSILIFDIELLGVS